MKRIIVLLIFFCFLLTSCTSTTNDIETSLNTTSQESSKQTTSEQISSENSSEIVIPQAISSEYIIPQRPNLEFKDDDFNFAEKSLSYGKYYNYEQIGDDELAYEILDLIQNNINMYSYYFLWPTLKFDGYKKINEDVYSVDSSIYTLTYDWLIETVNQTYVKSEAEAILNNPTHRGKRYHYFERDGITYIDQSVAKSQDFIPHSFVSYSYTYRYFIDYFTFDYEKINDNNIDIKVIFYDIIEQNFLKLPLKAVLEDGKWKLEKIVFEEDIVPVE